MTWSPTPIRNYRDYKLVTDFHAAELGWLWGINRGILTPPGMDDQWLVSLAHTDADMGKKWVEAFGELAKVARLKRVDLRTPYRHRWLRRHGVTPVALRKLESPGWSWIGIPPNPGARATTFANTTSRSSDGSSRAVAS